VLQIEYIEYGVVQCYSVNCTYIMTLERKHWTSNSRIRVNTLAKTIAPRRWKPNILCFWMTIKPVMALIVPLNCNPPSKSPVNSMIPPLEYAPLLSFDCLENKDEIMREIEMIMNSLFLALAQKLTYCTSPFLLHK
jgi:hypothetical protein